MGAFDYFFRNIYLHFSVMIVKVTMEIIMLMMLMEFPEIGKFMLTMGLLEHQISVGGKFGGSWQ